MDNEITVQKEEFHKLIKKLEEHLKTQNEEISVLKSKNRKLEEQLRIMQSGQTDIYTAITEKKRIALKQEIQEFIDRIENHLNTVENQNQ